MLSSVVYPQTEINRLVEDTRKLMKRISAGGPYEMVVSVGT